MLKRTRILLIFGLIAALVLPLLPVLAGEEAAGLTVGAYRYELDAEYADLAERLTDGDIVTRITMRTGRLTRVTRTDGKPLYGLYVTWYDSPSQLIVTRYAADGTVTGKKERIKCTARHQYIAGGEDCCCIEFTNAKGSYTVAELLPVESEADLPFSAVEEPCDAVVFVTSPGEEYTVYGGMLPALVNYGIDVQVIYLASAGRRAEEAAFNALRTLGIRREPIFWSLPALDPKDAATLKKDWKLKLKKVSVANVLNELSPTLIVAPDGTDESLTIGQQATGLLVSEGIEKAALSDETRVMLVSNADGSLSADWTDAAREKASELYDTFTTEWLFHRKIPASVSFTFADEGVLPGETGPVDTDRLLPLIFGDKALKTQPGDASSPSPAPSAAAEAASVSSADDIYFRREGEPEEVVSSDVENGHWEYRSDTLSVIVDRHVEPETPLVWCVAHIRMREKSSFRSIITSQICKKARLRAWRLARKAKAVLLITGDNLVTNDTPVKGLLIRNDRFYSDRKYEDAMMFGDDLGMTILEKGSVDGMRLLESGVTDTYSFGPVLLENGEIQEERIQRHRVANNGNPRCGVGMVEPGHLVAITVDGRQKDYSLGVDLLAFAQMFIDEGCTLAYNLDGGGSTAMVFMGENLNRHGGQSWDKQRYLPEALTWGYSALVPDESDPIENIGNGFGNLKEKRF